MKISAFVLLSSLIFGVAGGSVAMAYEKEIKNLSSNLSENVSKAGKKTVAVVDFQDLQGNITELGRFLAEELSGDLAATTRGFEVIDRANLKTILAEHKLSMSGLVDPNTVKKLGQIAGVDAIITGTITPFGESVRVSCKVIATDTAKVIAASKTDIAKTKAIDELLGRGIEMEATQTSTGKPQTKPAQGKESINVIQTAGVDGFVFELKGCSNSGGTVICTLSIINVAEDRNLTLYAANGLTRIIDESGEERPVDNIKLGNTEWKNPGYKRSFQHNDGPILVKNTPVKTTLSFRGISPEVASLALLEISGNGKNVKAQFRNILLTKGEALLTSPPPKVKRR